MPFTNSNNSLNEECSEYGQRTMEAFFWVEVACSRFHLEVAAQPVGMMPTTWEYLSSF
jgi:hypothetical protein